MQISHQIIFDKNPRGLERNTHPISSVNATPQCQHQKVRDTIALNKYERHNWSKKFGVAEAKRKLYVGHCFWLGHDNFTNFWEKLSPVLFIVKSY